MFIPSDIKIYHITHLENLKSIIDDNGIWSDSEMLALRKEYNKVGISTIKRRRMNLLIDCHYKPQLAVKPEWYY